MTVLLKQMKHLPISPTRAITKNFKLSRETFKRGSKAVKRGLSKEKMCIPCGINLNGLSIAGISNLGKLKWMDIEKVLGGRTQHDSIFVTDSFHGYQRSIAE